MGATVGELPGAGYLQHFSVLHCSAIGHRYHPLWHMVGLPFLNTGGINVHEVPLSRAGIPTVYNPQCINSGPTGLCVRPPLDKTADCGTHELYAVQRQRGRTGLTQV